MPRSLTTADQRRYEYDGEVILAEIMVSPIEVGISPGEK